MKRKFVLLLLLAALFAQVRFMQHEFVSKANPEWIELMVFNKKTIKPPLSPGAVSTYIVRKKVTNLSTQTEKEEQVQFIITRRITNN